MANFCVEGKTGQFSVYGSIAGTYEVVHVYKDEIKEEPAAVVRLSYNEEHKQRGLLDSYSLFDDKGLNKNSYNTTLLPDKHVMYAVVNRDAPISARSEQWIYSSNYQSSVVEYSANVISQTRILKVTVEEV